MTRAVFSIFRYSAIYLLIISSTTGIIACSRPQPALIKGNVTCTQNRQALFEGVQVIALNEGKELGFGAVNQQTGEYFIALPEKGVYNLRLKTPIKVMDLALTVKAIAGELVTAPTIDVPEDALLKPSSLSQPSPEQQPLSITTGETHAATMEGTHAATPETTTPAATAEGGTGGK